MPKYENIHRANSTISRHYSICQRNAARKKNFEKGSPHIWNIIDHVAVSGIID